MNPNPREISGSEGARPARPEPTIFTDPHHPDDPNIGRRIAWEECERLYPNEWVLLENTQKDESRFVANGVLRAHSPDRDEIERIEEGMRLRQSACFYTGAPCEGEFAFFL